MKRPRVHDFDPKSQEKLLKSPMDDFPPIQNGPSRSLADDASTRSTIVPPVRGTSRRKIKTRHPFDIYEDQVETLRQLSYEDRMRGGTGSQSAMVREAIDDFIAKRQSH